MLFQAVVIFLPILNFFKFPVKGERSIETCFFETGIMEVYRDCRGNRDTYDILRIHVIFFPPCLKKIPAQNKLESYFALSSFSQREGSATAMESFPLKNPLKVTTMVTQQLLYKSLYITGDLFSMI